jgi:hypothetical protein
MSKQEPDSAIEALDDSALRARLARSDWNNDPLFVSDERVFRMFRRARAAENKARVGLFTEVFSLRLLERSRTFVLKAKIFPGLIDDLPRASHELASCLWGHLLSSASDAAHAEKAFGQLFDRRAISFQRSLLAKKRKLQKSLDEMDEGDDEGVSATEELEELQDHNTPDLLAARRQEFERANGRLLEILTQKEYATFVWLYGADWQVQEVAAALRVTVKSVNNYKNSALDKIRKEFQQ